MPDNPFEKYLADLELRMKEFRAKNPDQVAQKDPKAIKNKRNIKIAKTA